MNFSILQSLSTINEQSAPLIEPNEESRTTSRTSNKNLLKALFVIVFGFNLIAIFILFKHSNEDAQLGSFAKFNKYRLISIQRKISNLTSNELPVYLNDELSFYCNPVSVQLEIPSSKVIKKSLIIFNNVKLIEGKDYRMYYNVKQNYSLNYIGLIKLVVINSDCGYDKRDLELNIVPLLKFDRRCTEYSKVIHKMMLDVGFNALTLIEPLGKIKRSSIDEIIINTNKTIVIVNDLVGRILVSNALVHVELKIVVKGTLKENNIGCQLGKVNSIKELTIVANGRRKKKEDIKSYEGKAIVLQLAEMISRTRNIDYNVKLIFLEFNYNKNNRPAFHNQTIYVNDLYTQGLVSGQYCYTEKNFLVNKITQGTNPYFQAIVNNCKLEKSLPYLEIFNTKGNTETTETIKGIEYLSNAILEQLIS